MKEHRVGPGPIEEPDSIRRPDIFHIGSFQAFRAWCDTRGVRSLPADPTTVATFVGEYLPRLGVQGLRPLLRAVRRTHLILGHADPTCGALDPNALRTSRKKKPNQERPADKVQSPRR
jgi:hypothetical protein